MLFFPADIKNNLCLTAKVIFGTPEGTRTPDLLVRSQSLYPAELQARIKFLMSGNRIEYLVRSQTLYPAELRARTATRVSGNG